jgi:adenylate kinase
MKSLVKNNKIGVILFGPQGSGKGTQAKLLADRFDLFHLDSGGYLRKILYDPELQKNKTIQREKKLNEAGILNTESWIMKIFNKKLEEVIKLGKGIVTEGYPRRMPEVFGDKKTKGALAILEKGYGKKNVFIFILNIPEKESVKRLSGRFVCSVCKTPLISSKLLHLGNIKFKNCPFCGGKVLHRVDDNKKAILVRLKQYREQTQPIYKELERKGYRVYKIDGRPMPYKIHETIMSKIFK